MATKASLNTKGTESKSGISDTCILDKKTDFNTKNTEIGNKIIDVSDFDTRLRSNYTKVTLKKNKTST